ncbi:MAG: lamin tail domain-containing protein [Verrucomicrobiales bacterium]
MAAFLLCVCPPAGAADYVTEVLSDNPEAYYRFEENAGAAAVADSSGNGHGSTSIDPDVALGEAGRLGNAARFNGNGSIVLGLNLNPAGGDFSIELLANQTTAPNSSNFVAQQDGTGLGRSLLINNNNGQIGSFVGGSTTPPAGTGVAATLGAWQHLVMTYDAAGGANAVRFYVDGQPAGIGTETAESATGAWVLGAHKSLTSGFINCLMDEVAIYSYRLDDPDGDNDTADSRIGAHYDSLVTPTILITSFSASPTLVEPGGSTTLSWALEEPIDEVTIDGIGDVGNAATGSREVFPAGPTIYTLRARRGFSEDSATVEVLVNIPADVRINEVCANNQFSLEDEDFEDPDWIELKNRGGMPQDIGGWFLTDGPNTPTKWRIPDGTVLGAGEFLVIFASGKDRADAGSELHANFQLADDGEYLALIEADGATVASAFAPALPPLPTDVSYGLVAGSDALAYFSAPTPGAENAGGTAALGPILRAATESAPPVNRTAAPLDESLTITAQVVASSHPVASVTLFYRLMFAAEASIPMRDDGLAPDAAAGDGIYAASLPLAGLLEGEMVRWRIAAEDDQANLSRLPDFFSATQAPEYFGTIADDPGIASNLPVFHWFTDSPAGAETRAGARSSVYYLGQFYDNVFTRVRGGSSASLAKKSFKFDFNPGHKFRFAEGEGRVEEINLNTTFTDKSFVRQPAAFDVYDWSGSPGPRCFPIRIEQNNAFFSVAAFVEQPDEDMLDREGLDPEGAFYKMFNTGTSGTSGVEKKTRLGEGNADLTAFLNGLNNNSGAALDAFIFDNVDTAREANYLAATVITQNGDSVAKNYMFIVTPTARRMVPDAVGPRPHLRLHYMTRDSILGDTIWSDEDYVLGGAAQNVPISPSHPFVGTQQYPANRSYSRIIDALLESDRFRAIFKRRLRTLLEDVLQAESTPVAERRIEARLDELAAMVGADADLDQAKWTPFLEFQTMAEAVAIIKDEYLAVRRPHLLDTHLDANAAAYAIPNSASAELPGSQPASPAITIAAADGAPASGNQEEEYIELANAESTAIDLSGWRLEGGVDFELPPGTVIEANGSLILAKNSRAFRGRAASPTGGEGWHVQGNYSGQISGRGEEIRLVDASGALVDSIITAPAPSPAQEFLRVTELNFHPAEGGAEFIELRNISDAETLDLGGVAFTDGVDFAFADGSALAPGDFLLLVRDAAAFEARYGAGLPVAGTYAGALSNGGEQLTLRDALGENVLSFEFKDGWFAPADGGGRTLEIRDDAAAWDSWDRAASWQLSAADGGTPGAPNSAEPATSFEEFARAHFTEAERDDPAVGGASGDPAGTGLPNLIKFALGIDPRDTSRNGLPAAGIDAGTGLPALVFRRQKNAPDLIYEPQGGGDLLGWQALTEMAGAPTDNGDGTETVTFRAPPEAAGAPEYFLRLKVVRRSF